MQIEREYLEPVGREALGDRGADAPCRTGHQRPARVGHNGHPFRIEGEDDDRPLVL